MKNNEKQYAAYWIDHLKMTPHPEGGYYREEYRSKKQVSMEGREAKRQAFTIYWRTTISPPFIASSLRKAGSFIKVRLY